MMRCNRSFLEAANAQEVNFIRSVGTIPAAYEFISREYESFGVRQCKPHVRNEMWRPQNTVSEIM